MANELEILTENAASDGWVDSTPGPVSTGYQAQNTAIQAHSVGEDKTYVYVSGSSVIVATGGLVDIDGLPFKITSDVTLTPASAGTWYIRVVPGADALSKSLELTDDPGTWNAVKNGLYDGDGYRVLNWVVSNYGRLFASKLTRDTAAEFLRVGTPGILLNLANVSIMPSGSESSSFSTPSTAPFGVAVDPFTGNLISCDQTAARIYIHDGISASTTSDFASPSSSPVGVAVDPFTGNLISCDTSTELVYIHNGISSSTTSSFSLPGTAVLDIAIDPSTGNLLSSDGNTHLIYIHDGISDTILSSFAAPGNFPNAIAVIDTSGDLVSIDSSDDEVSIHVGISSTVRSTFPLVTGSLPRGCAIIPSTGKLIECDNGEAKFFIYSSVLMVA